MPLLMSCSLGEWRGEVDEICEVVAWVSSAGSIESCVLMTLQPESFSDQVLFRAYDFKRIVLRRLWRLLSCGYQNAHLQRDQVKCDQSQN
jgi:hypothetical protein